MRALVSQRPTGLGKAWRLFVPSRVWRRLIFPLATALIRATDPHPAMHAPVQFKVHDGGVKQREKTTIGSFSNGSR